MKHDPRNPFTTFTRGVEGDVLWFLGRTHFQESASHIATMTERSRSQVMAVLSYMVNTELVVVQRYEQWCGHRLNLHHPLTPLIRQMAKMKLSEDLPRTAHPLDAVDE